MYIALFFGKPKLTFVITAMLLSLLISQMLQIFSLILHLCVILMMSI